MFFQHFTEIHELLIQNLWDQVIIQMKFLAAAFTFLTLFAVNTEQACSGWEKQDLIQSGTIQFSNRDKLKETCYDVSLKYDVPRGGDIQVAVSANQLHYYRPSSGLDYSLRAGKSANNKGISVSLLIGTNDWTKVTASYLATSRNDIIAGSFIADTFELFGCDRKTVNKASILHTIPNFPNSGAYKVSTFISGIKTQDNRINAQISDSTINSKTGQISLKITSNANPSIQNLYINYIVWETKSPFKFELFSSLSKSVGDYYLAGANQFVDSQIRGIQGLGITSQRIQCVGSLCPKNGCLGDPKACYGIGGEIINGICVACNKNEKYTNGKCVVITCGLNQISVNGKCVCSQGYDEVYGKCILSCGRNEVRANGKCVCNQGFVSYRGSCAACPRDTKYQNGNCVCTQKGYWWSDEKFVCEAEIPSCPPRSKWNQSKLACECTSNSEYLIGNQCKPCGKNEGWNGKDCVCVSNYYKVNGACQTCDQNSTYNGRQCVCNHGFFDWKGTCERCDNSCGKCSGSRADQCLTCSDVSYSLKNGYCTRGSPCPKGLFLNGKQCKPCSSYCDDCTSEDVCTKCINGFQLQKLDYYGKSASYCTEICGDGKRFQLDCDDGNKRNGDGCTDACVVEKGWTCQGGSSVKPSTCVSFAPERSIVSTTGTAHLFGRVVQGIRMTYLPPSLTENECALCSKLLWIRVIDSSVVPGIRLNYLPKSKYQFLAEFEFNGLFSIPIFKVSIQINPDFAKYFSKEDMAQIQVKRIDPALLILKGDSDGTLGLDDVFGDSNKISISDRDVKDIFNN